MESIIVDLKEFGIEGQIILAPPPFSRKNEINNLIGKESHYKTINGQTVLESQNVGNIAIYGILTYIREAPFNKNSLQGFLQFTDKLDGIKIGNGEKLFNRLINEVKKIQSGGCDPLQNSQPTETVTSEEKSI